MGYLASDRSLARRANPKRIMPTCRSIVVLAMPYFSPGDTNNRVAAYAWGEDYHDVLVPLLKELVTYLEIQIDKPVTARWYTDTGPLLERDLASRAGLGWVGKNSMLIHPKHGSYFFLAELLLDLDLPLDNPFPADHCGTCTRCIETCPTGCILPDRTLEASKCLSYLTIENKGVIPPKMRERIGEWVFGCDVCQQVCPWNRFAPEQGNPAFAPRPGVLSQDLSTELVLTPQDFSRKFKGSPVRRAKRSGYLRNVSVALGNRGDQDALPGLLVALRDVEPIVRRHAAWALGQLGGKQAETALRDALKVEDVEGVIDEIKMALEKTRK
jgi:epoxyqueuosine reductase